MATSIIKTQTAKDIFALSNAKSARPIFGQFLYEGELGILFGDSNTGKSILANDIAFFASGGGHEWQDITSPNIPTMYIDLEMSTEQYARRYNGAAKYITDRYTRAEVDVLNTVEDLIFSSIKKDIIKRQADVNAPKFIIVDNITNGFGSIFSATKMKRLVSEFKNLKTMFGLTVLLIAHCPKRKKKAPITDNDLGGSKMLINFCDSAFAIAPSVRSDSIKYIKQIKTRETQKISNVMTVEIVNEPYLSMKFLGWDKELVHIDEDYVDFELTPEKKAMLDNLLENGGNSDNFHAKLAEILMPSTKPYL